MLFRLVKVSAMPVCIVVVTMLATDALLYFLMPNAIARNLEGYRISSEAVNAGRGDYPANYFTSHPTRGFDISPGARNEHSVDGVKYPIWGNSLGCFDREWHAVPFDYYYFAGDSMTWGYTPFEQKFATIFSEVSGIPSLKCGVTHTGQRHQFDKFIDIVAKVGSMPRQVVVGYGPNDVSNDYAHPHSTVVDGWLVDNVFLDFLDHSLVPVDNDWIKERIAERFAPVRDPSLSARIKRFFRHYSAWAHVLRSSLQAVARSSKPKVTDGHPTLSYQGKLIKNLYVLNGTYYQGGKHGYEDTPFTAPNREALLRWKSHARENRYNLTLVLMSSRRFHGLANVYQELKQFLDANSIEYIDLFEEFHKRGVPAHRVYWEEDGHMSPNGNALVADVLLKRLLGRVR